MREIVLDTETTGLDPAKGHRVVEIGAVELINHIPSGRRYHVYIDPDRDMPAEAEAVHGLTHAVPARQAGFRRRHRGTCSPSSAMRPWSCTMPASISASSMGNWRLQRRDNLLPERVVDTLMLARQRHPMGPNSLDALCKRYGIDNSRRDKHGALLDAELLAEVYLELIGGRQAALDARRYNPAPSRICRQAASPLPRDCVHWRCASQREGTPGP